MEVYGGGGLVISTGLYLSIGLVRLNSRSGYCGMSNFDFSQSF